MQLSGRRGRMLAAAIVLLLAGCATGDGGVDADAGVTDPGAGGPGQRPTSIDPGLLECGDPDGADPTLQLTDVDLTQATWDTPPGFVESLLYSEDHPVEHVDSTWTAEPESDPFPLDVLSVVVYGQLEWGEDADVCGRVPIEAIEGRLAGYAEQNGARPLSDPAMTEVAGLPAIQQDIEIAGYSYRGYWLFDADQLMHVYCQWTPAGAKDAILDACEELVTSVQVPGA